MIRVHLLAKRIIIILLLSGFTNFIFSQEKGLPATIPDIKFHLTARPWRPLNISRDEYLDKTEGIVREIVKFQNKGGGIIDPYSRVEVQYSTPYFANAVGTLISTGRAKDLLSAGVAAMNSATNDVARGVNSIPDEHGEFFLAPLANAIPLYTPYVSATQLQTWKRRMVKPVGDVVHGGTQNWRTYAMKGEWYRAKNGYVNKATAVRWLESSWIKSQKKRLTNNIWNFYHDQTSDPDTWQYDAAARGNLLAMIAEGYDGVSRNEILTILKKGTQSSLLLQDPSGQAIAGGRSGNHTWNDIVLANGYETLAEISNKEGNFRLAGQYRRAAALGFQSAQRWRRKNGTYSVTKNHFDPRDRTRYATYSYFTNYNGYMMYHMAENYLRHKSYIPEQPMPNEIGGYTIVSDKSFATAVANAGGMQMQVGLRGSTDLVYNLYWTTLGAVRFSRTGWDSRLGPSDGVRESLSDNGASFAPTFLENGKWVRLASVPNRYEGFFSTQFTHPLLVRCRVVYKPKSGKTGPTFTNDFVITPDGIFSTLTSSSRNFGITWPLLTFDGATKLNAKLTSHIASTAFPGSGDEQNFIAFHSSPVITAPNSHLRSSYGDLLAVRMVSNNPSNVTFIYPRNSQDPSAETVRKTFTRSGDDFSTLLSRIAGNTYVGRTSAGGEGTSIDLNNDGIADATFSAKCQFIMQLNQMNITSIEADRDVTVVISGQTIQLYSYTPIDIKDPSMVPIASIIASSDDGNIPSNTIDKDLNKRWSASGRNQWIRYYFNKPYTISSVKIAWYKGDERKASFDIQTSMDGVNWTTVYSGNSSGTTTDFETYNIEPTSAQYVRIVGHGNTKNSWNSLNEVQIIKESTSPKNQNLKSPENQNKSMLFTQATQPAEVKQGNSQTMIEYISTSDSIPVNTTLTAVDRAGNTPEWLTVKGKILNGVSVTSGTKIPFNFDASNLFTGKYSAVITASAVGYNSAVLHLSLTVKPNMSPMLTKTKVISRLE
ncbi:MAG: discoidin domain-containing protein [Segetibacter sp.]